MEFIPCSPENQADCPVRLKEGVCYEDIHHLYWPKKLYRTLAEKAFRELDINKVRECRDLHNTEHALEQPPEKPSRNFMMNAIAKARAKEKGVD